MKQLLTTREFAADLHRSAHWYLAASVWNGSGVRQSGYKGYIVVRKSMTVRGLEVWYQERPPQNNALLVAKIDARVDWKQSKLKEMRTWQPSKKYTKTLVSSTSPKAALSAKESTNEK